MVLGQWSRDGPFPLDVVLVTMKCVPLILFLRIFQEHCMREMLEKFNAQSAQMDGVVHEANTEINRLKERVETLERGEQEWRRRNAELAEGFRDKGRRLAQVQVGLPYLFPLVPANRIYF